MTNATNHHMAAAAATPTATATACAAVAAAPGLANELATQTTRAVVKTHLQKHWRNCFDAWQCGLVNNRTHMKEAALQLCATIPPPRWLRAPVRYFTMMFIVYPDAPQHVYWMFSDHPHGVLAQLEHCSFTPDYLLTRTKDGSQDLPPDSTPLSQLSSRSIQSDGPWPRYGIIDWQGGTFLGVLQRQLPLRSCADPNCTVRDWLRATLKRCSGCHTNRYCSRECQRRHWAQHKSQCAKQLREAKQLLSALPVVESKAHVRVQSKQPPTQVTDPVRRFRNHRDPKPVAKPKPLATPPPSACRNVFDLD